MWWSRQDEKMLLNIVNEMKGLWQELDLRYDDKWECENDDSKYHNCMESDMVYVFVAGLNKDLDEIWEGFWA